MIAVPLKRTFLFKCFAVYDSVCSVVIFHNSGKVPPSATN